MKKYIIDEVKDLSKRVKDLENNSPTMKECKCINICETDCFACLDNLLDCKTLKHQSKEYCLRCGLTKKEAYSEGGGCNHWGEYYKRHMWYQPSEEKDQYGHKIIRPTLPDDTFAGLKEEIKKRVSEEKEIYDGIVRDMEGNYVRTIPNIVGVTPKQEEWEERLDKEIWHFTKSIHRDVIKSFISQLLKKEREKVIEEVKKNTKDLTKYETEFTCPCGQEHSVQFLIRKPKVMKGKITEITINSEQLKK